jgi:CDP-diacylglycerol--glycerol-3-phosphate 3-phosphatidyltransferase
MICVERPSTSARLRPTDQGVIGVGRQVGSAAVCTSSAIATTEPVGCCEVENIRQGENGHHESWPTSEPARNSAVSTASVRARHARPVAGSRSTSPGADAPRRSCPPTVTRAMLRGLAGASALLATAAGTIDRERPPGSAVRQCRPALDLPCRTRPVRRPADRSPMLNRFARALFTRLLTPVAMLLLRAGVSPDIVTLVGTLGVVVGALAFYPTGHLLAGTLVIVAFVFSDTVDGIMARKSGVSSQWGAYLDSTLDRVGDAAVFSGLVLWYAGGGDDRLTAVLALACLTLGSIVSYAKARAEGLGMTANVGIAERADRLVAVLVAAGFVGLGVPRVLLTVVLGVLAVASLITVVQRILEVRRQSFALEPPSKA